MTFKAADPIGGFLVLGAEGKAAASVASPLNRHNRNCLILRRHSRIQWPHDRHTRSLRATGQRNDSMAPSPIPIPTLSHLTRMSDIGGRQ
jgi:hypothetical protein